MMFGFDVRERRWSFIQTGDREKVSEVIHGVTK